MYLVALVPLIIFGFYKNGIELFQKGHVGMFEMFRPILILASGIIGAVAGSFLREWQKDAKFDRALFDKVKGDVVEAVLVVAILPIASNLLVVAGVTFLSSLFLEKLSLNRIALMYVAIEGINVAFGWNEFANAYQASTVLNYDGYDLFFGSGVGGLFATNVFLIALGFIFLSFNKLYKKEMVVASVATFLLLGIVPHMVMGQYEAICPFIFGYNMLFVLVFVGPNLYSSSYTVKGQVVSGILIGLITYGLSFVTPYTAAILAVLATSLIKGILDRIFVLRKIEKRNNS